MHTAALKHQDYLQDNAALPQESWEGVRRSIAVVAEAACTLPGNINGPELEEFTALYGFRSCFA